jgi:hypothetical protein
LQKDEHSSSVCILLAQRSGSSLPSGRGRIQRGSVEGAGCRRSAPSPRSFRAEPPLSRLRSLLQGRAAGHRSRAASPSTCAPALPVGGTEASGAAALAPGAAWRFASSSARHRRRPAPPPPPDPRRLDLDDLELGVLDLRSAHRHWIHLAAASPGLGDLELDGAQGAPPARREVARAPLPVLLPWLPRGSRLPHPCSSGSRR